MGCALDVCACPFVCSPDRRASPPWYVHFTCAHSPWDVFVICKHPIGCPGDLCASPPHDHVIKIHGMEFFTKANQFLQVNCDWRNDRIGSQKRAGLSVKIFQLSLLLFRCRLIQDKDVDLVVNLPNQNTKYIKDNYLIRRSSIDCGVPLITNLEVYSHSVEILW